MEADGNRMRMIESDRVRKGAKAERGEEEREREKNMRERERERENVQWSCRANHLVLFHDSLPQLGVPSGRSDCVQMRDCRLK